MENEKKQFPICVVVLFVILFISLGSFVFLLLNPEALSKIQSFTKQTADKIIRQISKNPSSVFLTEDTTPVVPTIPIQTNKKVIPIKQGQEIYNISQGKTNGPKITKAIINPHDPQKGAKQTITVFANHTKPITWLKVTLYSDNQTQTQELSLSSGTSQSGTWSGSWTTNDTHLHKWGFLIEAGDAVNQSKVGIAVR